MACAWKFSLRELKELKREEFLLQINKDNTIVILFASNICNFWGTLISNWEVVKQENINLNDIDSIERVSNPREAIDWTHVDWIWLWDNARNGLLRRPDLGKIPDWLESVYPTIISVGVDRWSILEE